jgi:hypothetical protein
MPVFDKFVSGEFVSGEFVSDMSVFGAFASEIPVSEMLFSATVGRGDLWV